MPKGVGGTPPQVSSSISWEKVGVLRLGCPASPHQPSPHSTMPSWDYGDRDAGREPCPDRIVEDLGGAFGMGCVGGFIWHMVKGARNSPKGERMHGALYSAKARSPILGGNFAVWGGTFSTFDCSLQYIRKKDDHWNAIASGFCTGGVLASRGGWKAASRNAVIGGGLLAIIEGVAALIMRSTSQTPREMAQMQIEQEEQMREYEAKQARGEAAGGWTGFWDWMKNPEPERAPVTKSTPSEFVSEEELRKLEASGSSPTTWGSSSSSSAPPQ